jgi:hypothetical protein
MTRPRIYVRTMEQTVAEAVTLAIHFLSAPCVQPPRCPPLARTRRRRPLTSCLHARPGSEALHARHRSELRFARGTSGRTGKGSRRSDYDRPPGLIAGAETAAQPCSVVSSVSSQWRCRRLRGDGLAVEAEIRQSAHLALRCVRSDLDRCAAVPNAPSVPARRQSVRPTRQSRGAHSHSGCDRTLTSARPHRR